MLSTFIEKLIPDMELETTSLASEVPGTYALPIDEGITILISEIPNGIIIKCAFVPYPKVREEVFSTQAMLANLFGQGTRGSALGLTNDGNTLTLTQIIDYNIDYKEFKEILEDFINSIDFWCEEALNHK